VFRRLTNSSTGWQSKQLLVAADGNGIDLLGSWVCAADADAQTDYEVVVYELD